ncbi:ribonuclease P protein component [Jeotgalibaca dankookensis]|uniref:ribonuclease P protein component n=1 Tax=Jeotgalibaca dankookensis TaxID=708126 RepID=UPI000782B920|nr:ribonuclease P protein component [Jeotgalibaca dankookensis]
MRKSFRVKKEKEFQKVFHNGASKANRQFVIYVLPKEGQLHFRVGLSVGKKIGNAVVRNSVKRKIRQALLEIKPMIKSEIDFIIIARQPTAKLSTEEVKKNLLHVLKLAQVV